MIPYYITLHYLHYYIIVYYITLYYTIRFLFVFRIFMYLYYLSSVSPLSWQAHRHSVAPRSLASLLPATI